MWRWMPVCAVDAGVPVGVIATPGVGLSERGGVGEGLPQAATATTSATPTASALAATRKEARVVEHAAIMQQRGACCPARDRTHPGRGDPGQVGRVVLRLGRAGRGLGAGPEPSGASAPPPKMRRSIRKMLMNSM